LVLQEFCSGYKYCSFADLGFWSSFGDFDVFVLVFHVELLWELNPNMAKSWSSKVMQSWEREKKKVFKNIKGRPLVLSNKSPLPLFLSFFFFFTPPHLPFFVSPLWHSCKWWKPFSFFPSPTLHNLWTPRIWPQCLHVATSPSPTLSLVTKRKKESRGHVASLHWWGCGRATTHNWL